MKRRTFITLLSTGAAASVGAYVAFPTFEGTVKKILLKDMEGLKVKEDTIDKFLFDIQGKNPWRFSDEKKQLIMSHFYLGNKLFSPPYFYKYRQYRNHIVGLFLLSTDFFINKMDISKEVGYIGLYNPYERPCYNPFSSLYYPSV